MLNEFRRRLLDTVKASDYLAAFADPGRDIVAIDNYAYGVDKNDTATTITAAATATFNIVMDSDSDFVCTGFSGLGRVQASTDPLYQNPSILVQIFDKAAGRSFFNAPSPMPFIAGQGGFPFMLTSPLVIRARSALQITATAAVAGATFDGFYFILHGGRIFYR